MKQLLTIAFLFALITWPFALLAATITGTVTRVIDGDTIVVGTNKVRLAGIDAPERKQVYGAEAAQALADKVEGREVVVEWCRRGRYRRIIGTVYLERRNVNHELVKEGYAWWVPRYSSDSRLALAHATARNQRLGLWSAATPTAPWRHRDE